MSAEINQLNSINPEDFKVQSIGEESYLNLVPKDPKISPYGAVITDNDDIDFDEWIKMWNIDELMIVEVGGDLPCISRKLTKKEMAKFEYSRTKMIRCKQYGQNYYENSLMTRI